MSEEIYLKKFWPTPKTPARITIELNVREQEPGTWSYSATVTDSTSAFRGVSGDFKADSKLEAGAKAYCKLVGLLGECLADAIEDREKARG